VVAIASIQAVLRTNGLEVDTCKTLNFKTPISTGSRSLAISLNCQDSFFNNPGR
jgi:hypothetical protein